MKPIAIVLSGIICCCCSCNLLPIGPGQPAPTLGFERIVFTSTLDNEVANDVFTMNAEGDDLQRLTRDDFQSAFRRSAPAAR